MSGLWWIPIGLTAWLAAGTGLALVIGPVLKRSSQTIENLDDKEEAWTTATR